MNDRTTPEEAYTLPSNLSTMEVEELTDTIITRTEANLAALAACGGDLSEGFTLPHKDVMNVLWGIEGSLSQLRHLAGINQ